jgi:EAL domain-containing protein (putative c-di-GMP-specific phosphodiesterase class I)
MFDTSPRSQDRQDADARLSAVDAAIQRTATVRDLAEAIDGNRLVPVFQPIVDLETGKVSGCEILARWQHDSFGIIPPDTFVPMAERAGLLDRMLLKMLEPVAQVVEHSDPSLSFSINVSPSQLRDPWFAAQLLQYLHRLRIPPHRIIVEITEAVLIKDFSLVDTAVKSLRAQGIRIALDDFGTGYSNLQYLCAIDVDIVKIDRCFVDRLGADENGEKVILAVAGLASGLEFSITAEGIETAGQADLLRQLGCHRGQGYVFARPMNGEEFCNGDWTRSVTPESPSIIRAA